MNIIVFSFRLRNGVHIIVPEGEEKFNGCFSLFYCTKRLGMASTLHIAPTIYSMGRDEKQTTRHALQKKIMKETVAIAADHAGYDLKQTLLADLAALGLEVLDLGTHSTDSVDYPDYAANVVQAIKDGRATQGVLVCGSGIGMSIAANRHAGIRAALCHEPVSASLTRQHNNANILVMGARVIGVEIARAITRTFFTTAYEGGRHEKRISKLG